MTEIHATTEKYLPKQSKLWQAAMLSSSHFLNDIFTSILSPLLPLLIVNFSLSKFEAGMLAALVSWPSITQPIFGRLADKVNLQQYIFLFPFITATFMSLVGVAPNTAMLSLFLLLAGLSSACFHAVAAPIAGKTSGRSSGKGLSLWMIGGELGFTLGPILIIAFINGFSLQKTPLLIPLAAVAAAFLYFRLNRVDAIKNHTPAIQGSFKKTFKTITPMLVPIIFVAASRALLQSATNVYIPTYLTEKGANLWLAGTALSLVMGGSIVGTILGGIYKDKIGGKPVLLVSLVGSSIFFFMFLFTTNGLQIAAILLTGFFSGMYLPVALSMVQEYSPQNRSFANGTYLAFLFSIGALSNMVLGLLYDNFGSYRAFLISGIVSLFGILFIFLIPNHEHEKKLSMEESND
ncbi:MAG TPA: hypothetical protein DCK95_09245 [Anaerolineaceae bacterium]|nr:hypothetical protein [Anaerolineaceae bacterium]